MNNVGKMKLFLGDRLSNSDNSIVTEKSILEYIKDNASIYKKVQLGAYLNELTITHTNTLKINMTSPKNVCTSIMSWIVEMVNLVYQDTKCGNVDEKKPCYLQYNNNSPNLGLESFQRYGDSNFTYIVFWLENRSVDLDNILDETREYFNRHFAFICSELNKDVEYKIEISLESKHNNGFVVSISNY